MISLPKNFKKDVLFNDTQLVPIVLIGNFELNESNDVQSIGDFYYISTGVIDLGENIKTLPLLMNIPKFTESIDLEKSKKYKINNISINISNLFHNDISFSEMLGKKSLSNIECRIFWKSPNSNSIVLSDLGLDYEDNSILQLYYGIIRRYKKTKDTIVLEVEDRSQSKFHKLLPGRIGVDSSVPNGYKGAVIPKVYGHVDRSPCIISKVEDIEEITGEYQSFTIQSEHENIDSYLEIPEMNNVDDGRGFLYIHKGTSFFKVIQGQSLFNTSYIDNLGVSTSKSYHLDQIPEMSSYQSNGDHLIKIIFPPGNSEAPENALGENLIEVEKGRKAISSKANLWANAQEEWDNNTYGTDDPTYNDFHPKLKQAHGFNIDDLDYGSMKNVHDGNSDSFVQVGAYEHQAQLANIYSGIGFKCKLAPLDVQAEGTRTWLQVKYGFKIATQGGDFNLYSYSSQRENLYLFDWQYGLTDEELPHGFYFDNFYNLESLPIISATSIPTASWDYFPLTHWNEPDKRDSLDFYNLASWFTFPTHSTWGLFGIGLIQRFLFKNPIKQKYYVNVVGKVNNQSSPAIIQDIMSKYLGEDVTIPDSSHYFNNSEPNYGPHFKLDFTIDKEINSKKLIEDLSSLSPYMARYNYVGEFKHNVIKPLYSQDNYDHVIYHSDCVDWSYDRTKIEDIITKIVIKYKWNYGNEEFDKEGRYYLESFLDDTGPSGVNYNIVRMQWDYETEYYNHEAYGIKNHDATTYEMPEDLCKYIRKKETADQLAEWMLRQHGNPHLILKVKLPLNYMDIETGDIVIFDKRLGNGEKPYGIDYSPQARYALASVPEAAWGDFEGPPYAYGVDLNGQQVFPNMIVTKTNKTMEYVEITCYQLHNLSGTQYVGSEALSACTFPGLLENEEMVVDSDGNPWTTPPSYVKDVLTDDGSCEWYQIIKGCADPNDYAYQKAYLTDGSLASLEQASTTDIATYTEDGIPYMHDNSLCLNYDGPFFTGLWMKLHQYNNSPFGWEDDSPGLPWLNYRVGTTFDDNNSPVIDFEWTDVALNTIGSLGGVNIGYDELLFRISPQITYNTTYQNPTFRFVNAMMYGSWEDDDGNVHDFGDNYVRVNLLRTDTIEGSILSNNNLQFSLNDQEVIKIDFGDYTSEDIISKSLANNLKIAVMGVLEYYDPLEVNINPVKSISVWHYIKFQTKNIGDMNGDNGWNVLDIVTLANCVLSNNCENLENGEAGDMNGDGGWNVLDIVTLANCVLSNNCHELVIEEDF